MNIYLKDSELLYNIIISKGKGYLTKDAQNNLIKLCDNIFNVFKYKYNNRDDAYDMYTGGLEQVLTNYKKFNEKKYDKCIPFFTEVFKRGVASSFHYIKMWKKYNYNEDYKIIYYESFLTKKNDN